MGSPGEEAGRAAPECHAGEGRQGGQVAAREDVEAKWDELDPAGRGHLDGDEVMGGHAYILCMGTEAWGCVYGHGPITSEIFLLG